MPPDDVLPAIVPVGRFLVRAEPIMIALSHVSVYPDGCVLAVRASGRGLCGGRDAFGTFERLIFTAHFGPDVTTRLYDKTAPSRKPDGSPALTLAPLGQESSAGEGKVDSQITLWLSPLPPPERGTLSVDSPELGIDAASCLLDGAAIVNARAAAQPYWP